jgi:hypothetical protein
LEEAMNVLTNFHTEEKLFRVLKEALEAQVEAGEIESVSAEEDNDQGGTMRFVMDGRSFLLAVYETVPHYLEVMTIGGYDG